MATQDHAPRFGMLPDQKTHLFVLRVWARPDAASSAGWQWGGKVQEVLGSRAGYFGSWPTLVDLIQHMLPGMPPDMTEPAALETLPGAAGQHKLAEHPE